MRTIQVGNQTIGIKGTVLTSFYYKQAFGRSLLGDLYSMESLQKDHSKFDELLLLQFTWALAKTYNGPGKGFPDFETWLTQLEQVDFSDQGTWQAVLFEIKDGLFPRSQRPGPKGSGNHKHKNRR
ncbi:hypothetical protein [Anoxybacteroides tepidamans]|uniref:hypothetical protein n=1 Tax=Anoxybacteroides tepidamans TaxID=265948 RepID=UPI0006842020|nr:hypothetical protein [Anoxybacillus tepidamans]